MKEKGKNKGFKLSNSSTQGQVSEPADSLEKKKSCCTLVNNCFFCRILTVLLSILLLVGVSIAILAGLAGISLKDSFSLVKNFAFASQKDINSFEGRVGILLLGKSGQGYSAPDLTDTIMFISVSLEKPSLVLLSLPRDIWIPSIRAKLNSAYYWGKQKDSNDGLSLAKSLVGEIMGKPVDYGVVLDFSSFKRIIDVLGGIRVDVEREFTDEKYPIAGKENDLCGGDKEFKCRYETVRFEKGIQFMDGETALQFVRSRNAQGDEGTDIAREARQQKVIYAIKNRILSLETLFSPRKINGMFKVLKETLETDMDSKAFMVLVRRILESRKSIFSYVLPEEFLINPPISSRYDNQYVFISKLGDWSEIHNWIESLLN